MKEAIVLLAGMVERLVWVVMAEFVLISVLGFLVLDLYKRRKK